MSHLTTTDELFFDRAGLDRRRLEGVVDDALGKADDGELFLEYRQSEGLSFDDGRLKSASFDTSQGFGLRAVVGETSAYAHASELSEDALRRAGETVKADTRPIVIITSNNEKELPDAFLRRCFFHYIRFPDTDTMKQIVDVHFPDLKSRLLREALTLFYEVREVPGLKKKPSTSELLDWIKLLVAEDIDPETLRERDATKIIPPLHGALLKNEQDVHLFERLAFMARREGRGQ